MLGQLINTLLYIMLFADVLERRFPEEFKRIMIELSYTCIYAFSKLQIIFGKANVTINKYIETNPTLAKIKDNVNSFLKKETGFPISQVWIKDGKPINIIQRDGERVDKYNDFDLQIVSWYSETDKCVNKKIVYKNDKQDDIVLSGSSDIKFMLLEIQIGENANAYKIDLKTDEFNYNLVDNRFTKQFFIYYLKEYSKVTAEINEDTKLTLKLIDHDVNSIHIDFTNNNEYIELEKNSYKTSITNKAVIKNIEEKEDPEIIEDNLEN